MIHNYHNNIDVRFVITSVHVLFQWKTPNNDSERTFYFETVWFIYYLNLLA